MSDETFSATQMAQLKLAMKEVMREDMADAGLRLDGADHIDEAREDYRFIRKLRKFVDGTASKVGWAVIAAFIGGLLWLINAGLNFWKGN